MKVIVVAVLLLLTICDVTLSSAASAPADSRPCFEMNYSSGVLVMDTQDILKIILPWYTPTQRPKCKDLIF